MSARRGGLEAKHPDKESAFYKTKKGQPHFFGPPKQWSNPRESVFGKARGGPPQFLTLGVQLDALINLMKSLFRKDERSATLFLETDLKDWPGNRFNLTHANRG